MNWCDERRVRAGLGWSHRRGAVMLLMGAMVVMAVGCGGDQPPGDMMPDGDGDTPPTDMMPDDDGGTPPTDMMPDDGDDTPPPPPPPPADVVVEAQVTAINGGFLYSYMVTNNTDRELVIISIEVPSDPAAVANLTAPAGFAASFDSGLGVVDFVMDTSTFSGMSTVGSFTLESPLGAGPVNFTALDMDGGELTGTTEGPAP